MKNPLRCIITQINLIQCLSLRSPLSGREPGVLQALSANFVPGSQGRVRTEAIMGGTNRSQCFCTALGSRQGYFRAQVSSMGSPGNSAA
jgi:hypothetical protein